ncbi:helix-turn-helix domain-containing protein [Pantoea ananatis]|uniref:helix-turn-helix domain-containing protein n=1 Tax=Pantoea ananas TaxID=553 RepID=UPI001FF47A65|nr:helix-turn-helix domain-containing protein [Pantoea ananatis]MCK0552554.1 helix-turn-helix domain-containing protein [Pantoea ananatis]
MSSKILGNVWDACAAHDVKGAKLMIMARLADYSNDDGVSYPSVETICRQLGLGESTVRTAIAELEVAGWLRREARRKGNRNTSNLYHLNADRLESLARIEKDRVQAIKNQLRAAAFSHPSDSEPSKTEPSDSERSKGFHPSDSGKNGVFTRQNLTPDPQVNSKHEPQVNSKHEPQGIVTSAKAAEPSRNAKKDYSPEFEEAWQAYPKRSGGNPKPSAWKAWSARIREGVKPSDMLAGVQRYASYVTATGKANSEYVKQASTFFGPDHHFAESWTAPAPQPARNTAMSNHHGFDQRDYGQTQTPDWYEGDQE